MGDVMRHSVGLPEPEASPVYGAGDVIVTVDDQGLATRWVVRSDGRLAHDPAEFRFPPVEQAPTPWSEQ